MRIDRRQFLAAAAALSRASAASRQSPLAEQALAGRPLRDVEVVDVHGHFAAAPADAIWPHTLEAVLEDLDRCGIQKAVLSHLGAIGAVAEDEFRRANAEAAAAAQAHPERIRAYQVFHPHLLAASLAAAAETVRPGSPCAGFKLHSELHRHPVDGPAYRQLYEIANASAVPVLLHVGGDPREWIPQAQQVAAAFPRMPLIVAHLGGGEERATALLNGRRPNLFVDTCLSISLHRELERIVRKVGAEKVLFGTDAGYLSVGAQLGKVVFADLPEGDKRAILGGNAKRIFGTRL